MNQLTNKIISLALVFSIFAPTLALAVDPPTILTAGTFTILKKDQPAPFTGFLFDQSSVAKLLAETEYKLLELKLKSEFTLKSSEALWKLKLDNSAAALLSFEEKHTSLISIKNVEIERLTKIALEKPNKYSSWWFVGGIVLGIGLTVGAIYGVSGVTNGQ